jgi:hypothetical protein
MNTDCLYWQIPPKNYNGPAVCVVEAPSGYSTLGLSMSELSFYSRISTGIPIVSLLAASSSEPREPGNPSILLLVVWIPEFQHVGEIGCGPFGIHASGGKQLPTAGLPTSRRFSDMH